MADVKIVMWKQFVSLCCRHIDELQEQNQKLLSVIRELSEKQEQEENSAIDSKYEQIPSNTALL